MTDSLFHYDTPTFVIPSKNEPTLLRIPAFAG
jgi:hypothetical protein